MNKPSLLTETTPPLATPVQYVKGVGPALAAKLSRLNIFTVEDLFYHIPNRYVDRRKIYSIAEVPVGKERVVVGQIVSSRPLMMGRRGRRMYEMTIKDSTGQMRSLWFHFHLKRMEEFFPIGKKVLLAGEIVRYGNKLQMVHPEIERIDNEEEGIEGGGKILPVYPLTEGLYQKTMRKIIRNAWDRYGEYLKPSLPVEFLEKYRLADPWESIAQLHFPASDINFEDLNLRKSLAHQTLIFDEFFFLELGLALKRSKMVHQKGIAFHFEEKRHQEFLKRLPFSLTEAQKRVLAEIQKDMKVPHPMNRLLQGDVGSGKTVIAMAMAVQAVANGYQVAVMAPTEILAEQHFENFKTVLGSLSLPCIVLNSNIKGKEREEILSRLAKGEIPILIGTHALIQEGVVFAKLGLVIIDEQHRFGVLQRQALHKKAPHPDILVMTATPIPRTLAMTVYGDLDLSVIDELPQGRKKVITRCYGEKQREVTYQGIRKELEKGRQVFVVYPLIEESEKLDLKNATEMCESLKTIFEPSFRVALMHGRQKTEEREAIMHQFKRGEIHILATTSVVEVGIDCPNASVMVIEHAERFGLSQLHQLRGRVGRSAHQSYCILLADYRRSEDAKRRLQVMVESNDGFRIAEEDLEIRGPGVFLGTQQSGGEGFRVANMARDLDILSKARTAAFAMIDEDPKLESPKHQAFKKVLQSRWKGKLELVEVS